MSGLNHGFEKYFFLPSGGLLYPPDAWVSPVTLSYTFLIQDNVSSQTEFEHMAQIIKKHVRTRVEIEEMLLCDFYYLWTSITITDIYRKTYVTRKHRCQKCGHVTPLLIDYANIPTPVHQKNSSSAKENLFIIAEDDKIIEIERRKVKHNLRLPYISMGKKDFLQSIIYYITQQTLSIEGVDENDFYWYYRFKSYREVISIYSKIKKLNTEFGLHNALKYKCGNKMCGAQNYCHIYDDFGLCEFNMHGIGDGDKIEFYRSRLQATQMNVLSVGEASQVLLRDFDSYNHAMNQIKFAPRMF